MNDENKLAENKLVILYILGKMGISLTNSDIYQFVVERNIMDYINLQQCLTELTNAEYIKPISDEGTTHYKITDDGSNALNFFQNRISDWLLSAANEYILNNRKKIKREYDAFANYFPEIDGEYLVKCELCGIDGKRVMSIDIIVHTKEQALCICENWKNNSNSIRNTILSAIID